MANNGVTGIVSKRIARFLRRIAIAVAILLLLTGCNVAPVAPATQSAPLPTATATDPPRADGLTTAEAATLDSLERVDDYPLYTMQYSGGYDYRVSLAVPAWPIVGDLPALACSLFAAFGDADNMQFGRNFDWQDSPALLLFTDPPDGYASVSMVDLAYLDFGDAGVDALTDLPLGERRPLLDTPRMPFDGTNERGLVVGMAAVPAREMPHEADKEDIGSLMMIREMLDHASTVDEALALLRCYNIIGEGGPALHYLITDVTGRAVLVEFHDGQMVVIPNETPWHMATNFLIGPAGESTEGRCWRYDRINRGLVDARGDLSAGDAMSLLGEVSVGGTQWSIVYGISAGDIDVVMGREYDEVHSVHLDLAGE